MTMDIVTKVEASKQLLPYDSHWIGIELKGTESFFRCHKFSRIFPTTETSASKRYTKMWTNEPKKMCVKRSFRMKIYFDVESFCIESHEFGLYFYFYHSIVHFQVAKICNLQLYNDRLRWMLCHCHWFFFRSIVVTTSIFIVHDKKENRKNYHNLCEIKVNKHDWSMKPTKHVIHLPFQFMPRMGERMMNRTTWLRKVFIDCRLPHVVCLLNVCSISIYIYQFSHVTVDIAYFIENCAVFFFCGG